MDPSRATTHIGRDQFHLAWDRAIKPIVTVPSGSVVELEMLDASCGQITAESTADDLRVLDFGRVNPVNGPIGIEGAEPGDSLEIELLEFEPAGWGWTASIPGFGLLADDFPEPALRITKLGTPTVEFLQGIRIPLSPFCGELGVAPRAEGPHSTIPPAEFGGNMDTKHLTAGSKLYLPVFAPGARFSMGDGHAAQGDGEVCGTAIETPMQAVVRLSVRKDLHVTAPEFFTPGPRAAQADVSGLYATDGVGPELMAAARDAVRRMVDYLGRTHGLNPIDAYLLC
ncbi:MAG: acetamidase/formamidase family protein, partial [Candidatus Limnocylindria bacterium]